MFYALCLKCALAHGPLLLFAMNACVRTCSAPAAAAESREERDRHINTSLSIFRKNGSQSMTAKPESCLAYALADVIYPLTTLGSREAHSIPERLTSQPLPPGGSKEPMPFKMARVTGALLAFFCR